MVTNVTDFTIIGLAFLIGPNNCFNFIQQIRCNYGFLNVVMTIYEWKRWNEDIQRGSIEKHSFIPCDPFIFVLIPLHTLCARTGGEKERNENWHQFWAVVINWKWRQFFHRQTFCTARPIKMKQQTWAEH